MRVLPARDALSSTGRALKRTLSGCLPQSSVAEPDGPDIARLALATVFLPVYVAAAALTARLLKDGADPAAALAHFSTLFVHQTLALLPLLALMHGGRRLLTKGGNGALMDYALLLHLIEGCTLGFALGNAGAAASAMHHAAIVSISVVVYGGAILRGLLASSPTLVGLGVIVSLVPAVVVVASRTATALLIDLAGYHPAAYAAARLVNNFLPGA